MRLPPDASLNAHACIARMSNALTCGPRGHIFFLLIRRIDADAFRREWHRNRAYRRRNFDTAVLPRARRRSDTFFEKTSRHYD